MISTSLKRWNLRFGLGVPPSTGMREALQWLMLARLGVLYLLLVVVVLQQVFGKVGLSVKEVTVAYTLLAFGFSFNLIKSTFIDRLPEHWWISASQVLFDIVITSCWIYWCGTRESLLVLFYLILILVVSLIFFQKGGLYTGILSSVAYGVICLFGSDPDAAALWAWLVYSILFVSLGVVGGYLSGELLRTTRSLTEKQEKIERLTELHEQIISHLPTGLLTVDGQMRVNFINPAGEHILNRAGNEIVGKSLSEVEGGLLPFFSQIESEHVVEESERKDSESELSATGTEFHRSYFVETKSDKGKARLQQKVEIGSGESLRVLRGDVADFEIGSGLGKLLDDQAKGGRVLLFQDVTRVLHLEEKLKQHEKLAAVGQLAAGIAHEIRNPLASMSASIEMLKSSVAPEVAGENHKLMEIAIREIDRLNGLITEFLDYVKPVRIKFESVDIAVLCSEIVLAARTHKNYKGKENVNIKENYEAGVVAFAQPDKMKQVIWNLYVNAIQAMNKAGTVEIGCAKINSERVLFWVADQGCGMSEEVKAHLFEPFFTTKDKGTGLGLATVFKIVEAHHGVIRVESKPNVGTRFEIILPSK